MSEPLQARLRSRLAKIQNTLRPYINHAVSCTIGQTNPDGDFCTCGVKSAVAQANKLAEEILQEAALAGEGSPVSPATLYETTTPENRRIVDKVMHRVAVAQSKADAIGGGAKPSQEDDSQRSWLCGCYEDQVGYHLCLAHSKEVAPVSPADDESNPFIDYAPEPVSHAGAEQEIETITKHDRKTLETMWLHACGDSRTLERDLAEAKAELEALHASSSAPAAGEGWQPIETAPKDGTFLLGFNARGYGNGAALHAVSKFNGYEWLRVPGNYSWAPTHWMPLPDPPAAPRRDAAPTGPEPDLYCGACKTTIRAAEWDGSCPSCGNGTMQEVAPRRDADTEAAR